MVYHTRMKPQLYIGNKNYSTWSLRSWLLMREAGIDFDEHRILLDVETSADEIAAVSPSGTVPVLKIGDMTVWDTLAIAETVAERWPEKKLWPDDPDVRAIVASGYANAPILAEHRAHGFQAKIHKPFELEAIASALRQTVGQRAR